MKSGSQTTVSTIVFVHVLIHTYLKCEE